MEKPKTIRNKSLEEIRPAKGVKLKPKSPPIEKPKQESPKVIRNVEPPENLEPPTEEAIKIVERIKKAKDELIIAMRNFNNLLNDTKLLENKSESDKNVEAEIIGELIRSTQMVEALEQGEGIMSLCVFSTRLSLSLRNHYNKIAYKNYLLEQRIANIEKSVGVKPPKEDPKAKEKQFLLEQAEKLGIKINIEGENEED